MKDDFQKAIDSGNPTKILNLLNNNLRFPEICEHPKFPDGVIILLKGTINDKVFEGKVIPIIQRLDSKKIPFRGEISSLESYSEVREKLSKNIVLYLNSKSR